MTELLGMEAGVSMIERQNLAASERFLTCRRDGKDYSV